MGKKKKKQPETTSTQPAVVDWLEMKLMPTPKGSYRDGPMLTLTQSDSQRLDLINDDQIFVIVVNMERKPAVQNVTICKTNIVLPRREAEAYVKSPVIKSNRLSSGFCQIGPSTLLDRLLGGNSTMETEQKQVPRIETPLSTQQQCSSHTSKGFSFAQGGGGDAIVSPSKPISASGQRTPVKESPDARVWVVPTHNKVGRSISKFLCRPASVIQLKPNMGSLPEKTGEIIRKLFISSYQHRYVLRSENLSISFQGKELQLNAIVESSPIQSNSSLQDAMEKLKIQVEKEEEKNMSLLDAVEEVIESQNDDLLSHVLQYEVTDRSQVSAVVSTDEDVSIGGGPVQQQYVAGLEAPAQRVKSLLLPSLLQPDRFASTKAPRGVLLYGPSGVGKTCLAKQIAQDVQTQEPRIQAEFIHCVSLQSATTVVGEAERALTSIFDVTRPTLLIMDDIHLVCPKRGPSNSRGVDRLAATLLALVDGIDSNKPIGLVATTSDPGQLDPALRRPGRLDAEVELPIPDEKTRVQILRFQLRRVHESISLPALVDRDLETLAKLAKGFNGADCQLALKEATRKATLGSTSGRKQLSLELLGTCIRDTKPATIGAVTVEIPQVHWASIGGMDSVKESLREAIELPATHAALFQKLNIPPPKGILLYGPPGCSKTLMARALATESKMNFLAVKGPELLSKWLGASERALASLFRRARMASPCIIFFDEIDAIAAKRGGGEGGAGGERLLSQLLTELDGLGSRKQSRVVVVGATNRPDLLDTALVRPGRIDRMIYVGLRG